MSKIVNLFGGPCVGKSTLRANLFTTMKQLGVDCEEVTEWIKGPIWEERKIARFQAYVSAKQLNAVERVVDKVACVISDSPTLLGYYYSTIYGSHYCASTRQSIVDEFKRLGGLNLFIDRVGDYNQNGRLQTEEEADQVASGILGMLADLDIEVHRFRANEFGAILACCLEYIGRSDLVTDTMRVRTTNEMLAFLKG